MVMKLSELYSQSRQKLLQIESPQDAGILARRLLSSVTGKSPEEVLTHGECYLTQTQCAAMEQALNRVLVGEPLAYVLGQWEFYGLPMQVGKGVLIPRDDTCAVTELAIHKALFLGSTPRILDLCTGSGCIGLAIASRVKDAKVTLSDVSPEAMSVAKKNITLNKLAGRVSCVPVDALKKPSAFLGKFDMIVSNPPYITTEEMEDLPKSVKDYEPHLALHGGDDGLDFYRAICENFAEALKPGGFLCFEFGMGQGNRVCEILEINGYTVLERSRDYNDRERAVIARYDRKEE